MRNSTILLVGCFLGLIGCSTDQEPMSSKSSIEKQAVSEKKLPLPTLPGESSIPESSQRVVDESMRQASQAMEAMQKWQNTVKDLNQIGGMPVNWRDLVKFIPDKIGDFTAIGEVDGSTHTTGNMKVTTLKRSYQAGDRKLEFKIVDAFMTPMLRAPFAVATMIQEDSSKGYRKGISIEGEKAIAEWRAPSKFSNINILVADRFLVTLNVSNASIGDAEKLAAHIDINGLRKIKEDIPTKP